MTEGIVTLANDVVYDQLVALLNSIKVNVGEDFPVYVIAYDHQTDRVKEEVETRKNVEILDDAKFFLPWEEFSHQVWSAHPSAFQTWQERGIKGVRRIGMNRRYAAFDQNSPLEKFAYFDADVLVLGPLAQIFEKLDNHDVVVYDFQYKDPSHIYNVNSQDLFRTFSEDRINKEIFCAGFYASKRGFFSPETRNWLVEQLNTGEADVLYPSAPNQSVLNYMVMRAGLDVYNFGVDLPFEKRTGNSAPNSNFEQRDNLLYDKGNRVTYLHYIGFSSSAFTRICQGENLEIPYRDLFLHYRYLHEPEKRPTFKGKPKPYNPPPSLTDRILRKLKLKR